MPPHRKETVSRWLPLISVIASLVAGWVALSGRVSALEARVEERKDDIAQIRQDTAEVRRQVTEIYGSLIGHRK